MKPSNARQRMFTCTTGAARGAAAIIPPRKNAKPWKPDTPGAIARNEALRASKRFGRTIWRRWSGYHRRSRVETKMHYVKLLGQRLAARDFDRQVAEFPVRVAVLNGFTALGIPIGGRAASLYLLSWRIAPREVLAGLINCHDTPPFKSRHHPNSRIAPFKT
jgi:hypothetical protein